MPFYVLAQLQALTSQVDLKTGAGRFWSCLTISARVSQDTCKGMSHFSSGLATWFAPSFVSISC